MKLNLGVVFYPNTENSKSDNYASKPIIWVCMDKPSIYL